MLVICRKRDTIDMMATPLVMIPWIGDDEMITVMISAVMMMMLVFCKTRDAIDMLACP